MDGRYLGASAGQVFTKRQTCTALDFITRNIAPHAKCAKPVAVIELGRAAGIRGNVHSPSVNFSPSPCTEPPAAAGNKLVNVSAILVVYKIAGLSIHGRSHSVALGVI